MTYCDCGQRITHSPRAPKCLDCLQERALEHLGFDDPETVPESPPETLASVLDS